MNRIDNNYFTYRQTPATEEGTGTFDSIKGNTLIWNQLVQNGNFEDTSGWLGGNATKTASNNILSASIEAVTPANQISRSSFRVPTGHKHLAICDINSPKQTTCRFQYASVATGIQNINVPANTWTSVASVFEQTGASSILLYFCVSPSSIAVNDVIQFRNFMLFDLTAMFGSTKADEIYAMEQSSSGSGVAYFKSLFPLDYYPYDSGSLLNFGSPQEITWNQMVGAPRTVADTTTGGLSVSIKDTDNSITLISGTSTQGTRIRYNDYSMIAGHKYLVSGMPSDVSVSRYYLYFSDSTGNTSRGACLTQPSIYNCAYTETERLYLHFESGITVDNVVFRPQIFDLTTMFGAGNEPSISYFKAMFPLDYYPYSSDTVQTVNASGIMTVNADETEESSTILPISQYFPNGMKSAGSVYDELTPTKAITRVGTRAYQSGDESDTSVTTDGTNTNYALTTPTETAIDEDLTYPVYVGGTEQLLPVNESVPVTSPINGNITYRGLIPVSVNVYPLGSGTVTGSGQYRYKETVTITATPSDEVFGFLRYEDENGDTLATTSTYTFKVE